MNAARIRPAPSACEVREIRRVRSEPPPPSASEDRTERMTVAAAAADPAVDPSRHRRTLEESTDFQVMTTQMLEELRRRLRDAEAREREIGSGVRVRTPENGLLPSVDGLAVETFEAAEPRSEARAEPLPDVEIEIDEPRTFDEWDEVLSALPELEVALAPRSESNFYGGFDDEHPDGVFVATYRELPVKSALYVVVHLPGGYRFRSPALVEFVREAPDADDGIPAGLGLKMCGLDARMRQLIRNFCKHRPPMFYLV